MTSSKERCDPFIRFAENTALLHLLNDVPVLPSSSHQRTLATNSPPIPGRLTPEIERSLASAVAFLAGVSGDGNHVVAACVEETPGLEGLTVRLAINKWQRHDADDVLATAKDGLRSVFQILAGVTSDSDPWLQSKVFRAVLEFCRSRILQRIGSRRSEVLELYKDGPGTWLGNTLQTVADVVEKGISMKRLKQNNHSKAQSFVAISRNLEAILGEVETCRGTEVDQKLVQLIYTASKLLGRVEYLPSLLRRVSEQELESSTLHSLKRRLTELEDYHNCSNYLCEAAVKTSLLKEVRIVSVSLDEAWFRIPTEEPYTFDLDSCVVRFAKGHKGTGTRLLKNFNKSLHDARKEFARTAEKIITQSKIHAEIQILTHYHLHPSKRPPRFIGSNKNACYLCHKLVGLDGGYALPGTHGRLYPAWRLPNLPLFDELYGRLNEDLESQIYRVAKHGISRARQAVNYPYESPVLCLDVPIVVSGNALVSAAPSAEVRVHTEQSLITPALAPSLMPLIEHHHEATSPSVTNDSESEDLVSSCKEQPLPLTPGFVVRLQRGGDTSVSEDYTTRLLRMFTDFVCGKGLELRLERLTDKQADEGACATTGFPGIPNLDVLPLDEGVEDEEDNTSRTDYIMLKHGDDMIRMKVVVLSTGNNPR